MAKVNIRIDYDWLYGDLRSGHREGILEFEDEDYEEFKKDPVTFLYETGMDCDLNFIIDDYEIENCSEPKVTYEEV